MSGIIRRPDAEQPHLGNNSVDSWVSFQARPGQQDNMAQEQALGTPAEQEQAEAWRCDPQKALKRFQSILDSRRDQFIENYRFGLNPVLYVKEFTNEVREFLNSLDFLKHYMKGTVLEATKGMISDSGGNTSVFEYSDNEDDKQVYRNRLEFYSTIACGFLDMLNMLVSRVEMGNVGAASQCSILEFLFLRDNQGTDPNTFVRAVINQALYLAKKEMPSVSEQGIQNKSDLEEITKFKESTISRIHSNINYLMLRVFSTDFNRSVFVSQVIDPGIAVGICDWKDFKKSSIGKLYRRIHNWVNDSQNPENYLADEVREIFNFYDQGKENLKGIRYWLREQFNITDERIDNFLQGQDSEPVNAPRRQNIDDDFRIPW